MENIIDRMHEVLTRWQANGVRIENARVYVLRDSQWGLIGTVSELIEGAI